MFRNDLPQHESITPQVSDPSTSVSITHSGLSLSYSCLDLIIISTLASIFQRHLFLDRAVVFSLTPTSLGFLYFCFFDLGSFYGLESSRSLILALISYFRLGLISVSASTSIRQNSLFLVIALVFRTLADLFPSTLTTGSLHNNFEDPYETTRTRGDKRWIVSQAWSDSLPLWPTNTQEAYKKKIMKIHNKNRRKY